MQPLLHPKVHPKLLWKLSILCYFSKTWLKIWRKSWWSSLFWFSNFTSISFFCILYLLLLWKAPQPCMAGEELCLRTHPHLYFFPETLQIICICWKLSLEPFFSVISSQNLKIWKKISSHACLVTALWENFNVKTADPVLFLCFMFFLCVFWRFLCSIV